MFRAPILTLAAVVVLGLVLIGVDMAVQPPAAPPTPAASAAAPPPAAAAATAAVPPPADFPAQVRYVGDVTAQGTTIPIAVTVDGGRAKAYVCDGRHVEAWLQGTAAAGALDASGRRGNHLTGHLDGDRLTGTVHVAGLPDAPFTASPATGTRTGIYRQSVSGRTSGWIVRGDGGQVGLSHDGTGALAPAPPLPDGPLPAGVGPVDGTTDVLAAP
ncbi:hypothetical protein [Actinomycetospora sp. TBRC 11914]|uniref:hypothetical protein n=1 Tax=Actinomycetospora sp. TBRC 11914 TaxID=2729387 RepID=UPI00145D6B70|nr:hypothetical protein [Actinomycetospora sp. TBRC 11914]NMO93800.1 hypothetical protein [Actinomycetospora sp. TBRC 11914]